MAVDRILIRGLTRDSWPILSLLPPVIIQQGQGNIKPAEDLGTDGRGCEGRSDGLSDRAVVGRLDIAGVDIDGQALAWSQQTLVL